MAKRALRRAHTARLKRRIKAQLRQGNRLDGWASEQEREAYVTWVAGVRTNTRTLCSCWMCRSERKDHGNGRQGLTLQERRFHDRADAEEDEG